MPSTTPLGIHVVSAPTAHDLDVKLAKRVVDLIFSSVDATGTCILAIAGGSLPLQLGRGLAKLPPATTAAVPWEATHWFLVDERWTPHTHEDSNLGSFLKHTAPHIPADVAVTTHAGLVSQGAGEASRKQFVIYAVATPPQPTPPSSADADALTAAADAYGACLRACLRGAGKDSLDIILLGHGPDGHIASLFPGRPRPPVDGATVGAFAVHDSPKPPARRVTLTSRAINGGKVVVLVTTGGGKRAVTEGVLALMRGEAGGQRQADEAVAARETPLAMLVMARLALSTLSTANEDEHNAEEGDSGDERETGSADKGKERRSSDSSGPSKLGGSSGSSQGEGKDDEGGLPPQLWWFVDHEAAPSAVTDALGAREAATSSASTVSTDDHASKEGGSST